MFVCLYVKNYRKIVRSANSINVGLCSEVCRHFPAMLFFKKKIISLVMGVDSKESKDQQITLKNHFIFNIILLAATPLEASRGT